MQNTVTPLSSEPDEGEALNNLAPVEEIFLVGDVLYLAGT